MEEAISSILSNRTFKKSLIICSDEILEYCHWNNSLSASFLQSNSIISLNYVAFLNSTDVESFLNGYDHIVFLCKHFSASVVRLLGIISTCEPTARIILDIITSDYADAIMNVSGLEVPLLSTVQIKENPMYASKDSIANYNYNRVSEAYLPLSVTFHHYPIYSFPLCDSIIGSCSDGKVSPAVLKGVYGLASSVHRNIAPLTYQALSYTMDSPLDIAPVSPNTPPLIDDITPEMLPYDSRQNLKGLAFEIVGMVQDELGVDVRNRIYSMGKTSNLVGHSVQDILTERYEVYTEEDDPPVPVGLSHGSLILLDRTLDLVTPTIHGTHVQPNSSTTGSTPEKTKKTQVPPPPVSHAPTFAHRVLSTIPRKTIVNSNSLNQIGTHVDDTLESSYPALNTVTSTNGYDVAILNAPTSLHAIEGCVHESQHLNVLASPFSALSNSLPVKIIPALAPLTRLPLFSESNLELEVKKKTGNAAEGGDDGWGDDDLDLNSDEESNGLANGSTELSEVLNPLKFSSGIEIERLRQMMFHSSEEQFFTSLCKALASVIGENGGVMPPVKKRGMGAEIMALVQALISSPGHKEINGAKATAQHMSAGVRGNKYSRPRLIDITASAIKTKSSFYNESLVIQQLPLLTLSYAFIECMQRSSAKQFESRQGLEWLLSFETKVSREVSLMRTLQDEGFLGGLALLKNYLNDSRCGERGGGNKPSVLDFEHWCILLLKLFVARPASNNADTSDISDEMLVSIMHVDDIYELVADYILYDSPPEELKVLLCGTWSAARNNAEHVSESIRVDHRKPLVPIKPQYYHKHHHKEDRYYNAQNYQLILNIRYLLNSEKQKAPDWSDDWNEEDVSNIADNPETKLSSDEAYLRGEIVKYMRYIIRLYVELRHTSCGASSISTRSWLTQLQAQNPSFELHPQLVEFLYENSNRDVMYDLTENKGVVSGVVASLLQCCYASFCGDVPSGSQYQPISTEVMGLVHINNQPKVLEALAKVGFGLLSSFGLSASEDKTPIQEVSHPILSSYVQNPEAESKLSGANSTTIIILIIGGISCVEIRYIQELLEQNKEICLITGSHSNYRVQFVVGGTHVVNPTDVLYSTV